MTPSIAPKMQDEALLIGRILLVLLFVVFGWGKMLDYDATVATMTRVGAPMPSLAALVAIVAEVPLVLLIAIGAWTRPLALLLAVYTLGTALIGHAFWNLEGAARYSNAINFYKNISVIGGCLLLYAAGAGRYSVDAWRARRVR